MSNPKITIITCTYNSEKCLADCIESVRSQTYKNIEHLFIDGGSTDKTLDIIRKYYPKPNLISEKDKGIYDALNKGIKMTTGDIVGWLHSDDVFYNKDCLIRIVEAFDKNNIDYYCSKMLIYDTDLKRKFAVLGAPPHKVTFWEQFYSSTYYAHPTYYIKKKAIRRVGEYNLKFKIAADIDWLIRLEKLNLKHFFDETPLIKFRSSGKSAKKYFMALKEEWQIRCKHEGLSLKLIIVYSYHFIRRLIRYILEILKLNFIVKYFRKFLLKIFKR